MLREMAEAVEAITGVLIVVLEDPHWSDYSTLDLISFWRGVAARLMVINAARRHILGDHPLKSVKRTRHGLCRELPLSICRGGGGAVSRGEFPGHQFELTGAPDTPAQRRQSAVHGTRGLSGRRADDRRVSRWLVLVALEPTSSQAFPQHPPADREANRSARSRQRTVLEGASVVGMERSAVATGLDLPAEFVEQRCEALVRRHQLLAPARLVEFDTAPSRRYKFNHVLYLEVPYRLLPAMRRSRSSAHRHQRRDDLSRRVRDRRRLAMHFEQGLDSRRAVTLLQAADNATPIRPP
jgi:hypothetical protein